MNRFTVVWSPNELQRLTEIWLQSPDRAAMTAAAAQIERLLRHDPTRMQGRFMKDYGGSVCRRYAFCFPWRPTT
jgi:hypothetical protein